MNPKADNLTSDLGISRYQLIYARELMVMENQEVNLGYLGQVTLDFFFLLFEEECEVEGFEWYQ